MIEEEFSLRDQLAIEFLRIISSKSNLISSGWDPNETLTISVDVKNNIRLAYKLADLMREIRVEILE